MKYYKTKMKKIDVKKIADLAQLKLSQKLLVRFGKQLSSVLKMVSKIGEIRTGGTKGTSNITGLYNVFRQDRIESDRILSQEEALVNTKSKNKGYFVVKSVFGEENAT